MAKVLVERPRVGYRLTPGFVKGEKKRVGRALAAGDPPPTRQGMRRPHAHNAKHFNEHLGPLRRFLDSNVGRPWDKLYSEICAHVDRGNVVQKHILTHLFDYVVRRVVLVDGRPHVGEPGYSYLDSLVVSHERHRWYVCPKSGLLRRTRHVPRQWRKPPALPPRRVAVGRARVCLEIDGRWEMVAVAPLPAREYARPLYDVVRKATVRAAPDPEARSLYGADVYATARRVLSRAELRSLPVPIDWIA